MIIHHLMVEFSEVCRFYIEDCNLLSLMYRMLDAQFSTGIIEKILKIMAIAGDYFKSEKSE